MCAVVKAAGSLATVSCLSRPLKAVISAETHTRFGSFMSHVLESGLGYGCRS